MYVCTDVCAPWILPQWDVLAKETNEYSAVENFFLIERSKMRHLINSDSDFRAFWNLPDPLLTFLYGEKLCLAMTPNTRTIHGEDGKIIGGYSFHFDCPDNAYHPKVLQPFNLDGYWIPVTEGQVFVAEPPKGSFTRVRGGVNEILFLVHPSSSDLYAPLSAKYAQSCMQVPALALSSFRTLLVAVPKEQGGVAYEMVKVSLDETIGGVERRLHQKECSCSVATTALLTLRPRTIEFLHDDWSFVPKADLINPMHAVALERGAGMIHRQIPDWLSNPSSNDYVVPLFALFGRKNWPLLRTLIKQSGLNATEYIRSNLLRPIAELLVDHTVRQRTSLELHGQNILLRIRCSREGDAQISFAYRDMRGANTVLSEIDFAALPIGLRNRDHFYSETYRQDAAKILESVARRVCFELTKQLFKADELEVNDPDFTRWKEQMIHLGYAGNWTVDGQDPDAHVMEHSEMSFFRYGYFSKIFGNCVLDVLRREGIFLDLIEKNPKLNERAFAEQLGGPLDPCLYINWFEQLMICVLNRHSDD